MFVSTEGNFTNTNTDLQYLCTPSRDPKILARDPSNRVKRQGRSRPDGKVAHHKSTGSPDLWHRFKNAGFAFEILFFFFLLLRSPSNLHFRSPSPITGITTPHSIINPRVRCTGPPGIFFLPFSLDQIYRHYLSTLAPLKATPPVR